MEETTDEGAGGSVEVMGHRLRTKSFCWGAKGQLESCGSTSLRFSVFDVFSSLLFRLPNHT